METNSAITLQSLLEEMELRPYAYSGRGMYGATCLAVNVDGSVYELLADILTTMGENHRTEPDFVDILEDFATALRGCKTDSMGLGKVIYFPDVKYVDSGTDEEDSEDEFPCPGCGCVPGDGRTPGCSEPTGCGFNLQ